MVIKKNFFILVSFLLLPACFFCQQKADTLEQWVQRFSTINRIQTSENGNWILARKVYHKNADTTFLYNTNKPYMPVDTLVRKNAVQNFVGEHSLFVAGQENAQLINLKNLTKIDFKNVKRAGVLINRKMFFIHDHKNILSIYNQDGFLINSYEDIQSYATDKMKVLIAVKSKNNENVFQNVIDNNILYKTKQKIQAYEVTSDGMYLLITEKSISNDKIKPLIISSDRTVPNFKIEFPEQKADYLIFTPPTTNNHFVVGYISKEGTPKNSFVNIWYGNDKTLRTKVSGRTSYQFWRWSPSGKLQKISDDAFRYFLPLNNDNLFLSFTDLEKNNYILPNLTPDISLFNKAENNYSLIASDVSTGVISRTAKYILLFNTFNDSWTLFDTSNRAKEDLPNKGLKNPAFSVDEKQIFFESDDDLWIYNLQKKKLQPSLLAKGKKIKIVNVNTKPVNTVVGPPFFIRSINPKENMIVSLWDIDTNCQSYQSLEHGKLQTIIPFTNKKIKDFVTIKGNKTFTIEESFDDYPKIYQYTGMKSQKKQISGDMKNDRNSFKQDLLQFKNSKGIDLKGILYYPLNFEKTKKYPMVVKIYEQQNSLASSYLQPQIDGDGFSVRLLIENGYFVFLPDTRVDKRGPGISALDCVNAGLDAIEKHPNINQSKIGLMGHSFGGYETNFIATHSKRFAAYISGAGISNLVTKYFSYNLPLQVPDYSRLENAQFNFSLPFSENRELYELNNPINFVQNVNSPVLLWSGLKDEIVNPSETTAFYIGLLRNKKTVIALFYPNHAHSISIASPEAIDLTKRILEWWNYFLKNEKEIPWIEQQMKTETFLVSASKN